MTSLIQGILHARNINLARIAASEDLDDPSEATESSKYRRLQRFFYSVMAGVCICEIMRNKLLTSAERVIITTD